MAFFDDMKNKIKNVDTDKLKEQIGNATGAARNAVQQNLESLKNGQAGEKFNNLKGEYQKMPKNKKIIFGVCAIVALFIVIGGIKSIAGSDDNAYVSKLAGKWDCGFLELDFNMEKNTVTKSNGVTKNISIVSAKDRTIIVSGIDNGPPMKFVFKDDNNVLMSDSSKDQSDAMTCTRQ